jgi:hypothetical protein
MNRRQRRTLQHAARQNSPHTSGMPHPPEPVPGTAVPGRSSGPRTEDGKAASSRNAVRHGLCATKLVGADLEELNTIRALLDEEWEPATETEKLLLQQMALSQWRLDRALQLELAALDSDNGIDPAALALALRYRTSAERSFYKALSELQRLRTAIREDALRDARREKEEETAALRRLEAQILGPVYTQPAQFVSQNPRPDVLNATRPPCSIATPVSPTAFRDLL